MTAVMDYSSLMGRIKRLENDTSLDKDARFVHEFMALKAQYNFTATEVLRLLRPAKSIASSSLIESLYELLLSKEEQATAASATTKPLRRYKNPYTGEIVETRGSNHSRLKEWKKEYGAEALTSWREL